MISVLYIQMPEKSSKLLHEQVKLRFVLFFSFSFVFVFFFRKPILNHQILNQEGLFYLFDRPRRNEGEFFFVISLIFFVIQH